ncbi:hypothetical protein SO694_00049282 [Aureococcus anophagefferens]|uniref:U-box domain-containing protein n=1 Tax=Aureococcus anophagefferens TaxID=44056 RepID=A0ABR1G8B9_AURAN
MGQGPVGYALPGGAGGAIDDQAVSLLYMACVLGSEPQARRALDNGADVNNPGLSPLHVAAWYGYTDVALTLVQRGATLWRRTEKRFTALMLAAMNNHTDSVKMLLQNGAEVVPRDVHDLSVTRKKVAKDVLDILHEAAGMNLPRKETKRRRRAAKPVPPKETTRPRPATEPVPGDVRHRSGNILVEYVAHFVIVVLFGIIAFAFVSIGHFYLVATVLFTPLLVVAGFVAGYGALISFVLVVGGSCQVALWRGDRGAARRGARAARRPRPRKVKVAPEASEPEPAPPTRAEAARAEESEGAEEVDPTVRALLASLGLSSFEATFAEHLIDADALPLMTVEDLRRARASARPRPAARPAPAAAPVAAAPAPPVADAGDARRTGVCQSYVPMKKYGFIKPDEAGGSDIFVHANDIREGAVISEGDLVEYGVAPYKDRAPAPAPARASRAAAGRRPAGARARAEPEPEPESPAPEPAPEPEPPVPEPAQEPEPPAPEPEFSAPAAEPPAPEPEFSAIHAARMAHSKLAVDEVMDDAARHQAALEAELADHRAELERLRIRRDEVPERLTCPLTLELMKQPVIACDGHTYERCAIQQWLERAKTSPVTNERLRTPDLIPNHAMKAMIAEFLDHSRTTL